MRIHKEALRTALNNYLSAKAALDRADQQVRREFEGSVHKRAYIDGYVISVANDFVILRKCEDVI